MSLCMLRKFERSKLKSVVTVFYNSYSRRSSNNDGSYKIISDKKPVRDYNNDTDVSPNYEFLALTKGSPFFLPGNVGPAWHDLYSTVQYSYNLIQEITNANKDGNVECQIQSCPRVLRQTVSELFPNRSLDQSELSVVTLTMRPDVRNMRINKELETEKMAQVTSNKISQVQLKRE